MQTLKTNKTKRKEVANMPEEIQYDHSTATLYAGDEVGSIDNIAQLLLSVNGLIEAHNSEHEDSMATFTTEELHEFVQSGHAVIAVSSEGEPIGFAKLQYWTEVDEMQVLELGSWIVKPGVQHKGLGRQILNKAIETAKGLYSNPTIYAIVADQKDSQSKAIFEQKLKLEPKQGRPKGIEALINTPVVHFNITDL